MFIGYLSNAQTYKTVTVVQQKTHTLHSGGSMLGGKSRIAIPIELPPNTVEWYYSFTTASDDAGNNFLNLAVQVGAYATTGPLGATVAKGLKVPKGKGEADIWFFLPEYFSAFTAKKDIKYYPDLSEESATQAVHNVNKFLSQKCYLGVRNPSPLGAISITIEVVALVKEDNLGEDKAKLFGSMGWNAYERGELDKCVELSNKALSLNPNLGWVKFNIALVHLEQGKNECLDEYIDAITTCKKDANPKATLKGALDDIHNVKKNKGILNNMIDIESLINNELSKY